MGLGSLLQGYLCVSDVHFWLWRPHFSAGAFWNRKVALAIGSQGNSGCRGLWTHHLVSSTISLYIVKTLKLIYYLFFAEFIS